MTNAPYSPESIPLPLLTFLLGNSYFALLIEDVVEVTAMVEYMVLPGAPPGILGLINRHGYAVPLLDLRQVFGLPALSLTSESLFIVAQGGGAQIALLIDAVQQVEVANALQLSDLPTSGKYIRGIINYKGRLIPLVDIQPLLTDFLTHQNEVRN